MPSRIEFLSPRRWAWGLVGAVLGSWLIAATAVVAGLAPSAGTAADPLSPSLERAGQQVVLVGVPGLTWDLVDAERTPTLARMAAGGGTAALVLRGTHVVTCTTDAWLTVGAGQRAATDVAGCQDAGDDADAHTLQESVTGDRVEPERWQAWRDAAARRALEPQLGSLAALAEAAGTCVVAHGQAAVVGAVGDAVGTAGTPEGTCRIHLVSTPEVQERGRSDRLPGIDAALARLVAEVPEGTTVIVAGMGHTAERAEAQALVIWPVGTGAEQEGADAAIDTGGRSGAVLSSGSTRQASLVQLTDLTPTLLTLAGVDVPPGNGSPAGGALAGQPITAAPADGDHVQQARELASGVTAAQALAPRVLGALLVVVLPVLVLGLALRRRWLVTGVATVAMAVPPAAFLAGLVPWWRAGQPVLAAAAVILLCALLVAGAAWGGPWRRHTLGPAAVVAAVTAIVLGVDVIWSARLGLVSVLGLQPLTAGRFYGQGNVGFGVFLGALLVVMGTVAGWLSPDHRSGPPADRRVPNWPAALAVGLLGLGATVHNAAPQAGADFGGVPALVLATGLVLLAAGGVRWSPPILLGLGAAAVLVAAAAMVLDWLRGPEARTHLGDFVQSAIDGEAVGIVARKLQQSLGILVSYPESWLAIGLLLGVAVVVTRRPVWSQPLWRHPGLWATAVAGLVAMAATVLLNDSGVAAMAMTLTMLIAAALTVLARPTAYPADRP